MEEMWIDSCPGAWEALIAKDRFAWRRKVDHTIVVSRECGADRYTREDGREFKTFDEAASAPKCLKVGDRVRDLGKTFPNIEGRLGTVVQLLRPPAFVYVEFDGDGFRRGRYPGEVEFVSSAPAQSSPPAEPKFKVGDYAWCQNQKVKVVGVIDDGGRYRGVSEGGLNGVCVGPDELRPAKNYYHVFRDAPPVPEFDGVAKFDAKAFRRAVEKEIEAEVKAQAKEQALRYNSGKPESDYVFCYVGGTQAAYGHEHKFAFTLQKLGVLYRYTDTYEFKSLAADVVWELGKEAKAAGISIVEALADTNTKGGVKYEPGNFLKGANLRQFFQGAARHAEKPGQWEADPILVQKAKAKGVYAGREAYFDKGFNHDYNFIFNVLMIQHCITLGIGTDDRIKKP